MIEVEKQKAALGANADTEVKPNIRFKNFNDLFSELTNNKNIVTLFPIVTCIITYDSSSVITVTKKNDRLYFVKMYSLQTYAQTFEEKYGNDRDSYIKLKEVEQNEAGTQFAIVYMDDGVFKIRTFCSKQRTEEEIIQNEVNLNELLGLNNFTMPIQNFPDPFITCCFTKDDNLLFINLFHNYSLTHIHFFFNVEKRQVMGLTKVVLDSNNKNFPYKCFYNSDSNEIYSFYRQCQSFTVPVLEIEHP